jgi:multiple sugar transport system permease protein
VAGAMMWAWMLNGPFGVINGVLMDFGLIERRIAWLSDPDWAMGGVILANVWRGVPFFAIAFLAAMQAIPEEIYEAAEIDGVNAWQRFAYVTLPMLRGVIAVTVLLRTVWTFNWVETIFAMTNGGPAHATTTLPMYVFEQFFRFSDVGYASALAIMLFGSLLLFAAAYIRLSRMSEAAGR